jgi:predicted ATPase
VLRDLTALEHGSAELLAYCTEKRVEQIRLLAALHYAYARAMREPGKDNLVALRAAFDRMRSAGGFTGSSMILSNMAEAALQAGDLKRAEADLAQGFAFVEQSGERYYLADLHRLSGRLALRKEQPDLARAEACFLEAIDVARGQHGRLLELRAANDLARLWREGNSNNDVRALIEPILAGIEGGETAPDVREARDLLAALG